MPISRPLCAPAGPNGTKSAPLDQPATSTNWHQNSRNIETSRWGSIAPWKGLGTLNTHLRGPLSPPRAPLWAQMGQFWPGPARAQNGPKSPKAGLNSLRQAPAGFCVPVHGLNPLGRRVGCLFVVWCLFCQRAPFRVSVGPIWACLGPNCVPRSETENWPHLGLYGPDRDSEGTASLCKPLLLGVYPVRMAQMHR